MERTGIRTICAAVLSGAAMLPGTVAAQSVDLPTTCNPAADAAIDDGLTRLHNMMYIQAEEAFNRAAVADPNCATAQWGIAMSIIHPLWPGTPSEAETARGQAAAQRAIELPAGSDLEQALVQAAVAFYAPGLDGYRARLSAWADAQQAAEKGHAGNIDVVALAALSRLATAPRGPARAEIFAAVGDTLDALHQKEPDHPGVIHYAIHAYDNPSLKARGVPYAEIYDKIAPDAPHALHMPAHIFTRTGNWEKSVHLNDRSAKAALAQSTDIVQSHYAHAIDYMVYGHLQLGAAQQAERLVTEMLAIDNHQVSFGGAYALAASPVRLLLEQDDWSGAAGLSPKMHSAIPWEKFPQAVTMHWFAKGLGAARAGETDTARLAVAKLKELHTAMQDRGQDYWARLTEGQILSVEAWIELDAGNTDLAVTHQTAAADLEDSLGKSPVTPGHVLPARELLGDMLASLGRAEEAADAYRATLAHSPNRARSLRALK
ncbi:tetratricopeptide repeat protein [Sulfitobacter aestuariivivens]|uniref:Tetratricopeptide repeat protein n=1 Tax=Sulfitobacter aestuariivivens TaxID=2766981 RepID=A0A927D6P7_9RHOB|nr:hypothetical protein [Sulfitobacter aestuariivivens]MBD3666168.1 hypothetical protein [Sulfitobacter aestuariivivens]